MLSYVLRVMASTWQWSLDGIRTGCVAKTDRDTNAAINILLAGYNQLSAILRVSPEIKAFSSFSPHLTEH